MNLPPSYPPVPPVPPFPPTPPTMELPTESAAPRLVAVSAAVAAPIPPTTQNLRADGRGRRRVRTGIAAIAMIGLSFGAGYTGGLVGSSSGTADTTAAAVQDQTVSFSTIGSISQILSVVEPSVVSIETTVVGYNGRRQVQGTGAGTGVIIDDNGTVLTNAHVVEGATSITVTLSGETVARVATLVAADPANDIAVLSVANADHMVAAPIGHSDALQVGDPVLAIGNALALDGGLSVTQGIVSALDRSIETESGTLDGLIQTDAAISSGNSGGALVNAAGEVVGINTAVATSNGSVTASNIGFAIAIDHAIALANQLIAGTA